MGGVLTAYGQVVLLGYGQSGQVLARGIQMAKNATHQHNAVFIEGAWFCIDCYAELPAPARKRTANTDLYLQIKDMLAASRAQFERDYPTQKVGA